MPAIDAESAVPRSERLRELQAFGQSRLAQEGISIDDVPEITRRILKGRSVVDAESAVPASRQIADRLRSDIASGAYGPGDRLPSQPELAERYGVARETVKAALRLLRGEGLIVTRQGSGSFVSGEAADNQAELAALVAAIGIGPTLAILRAVKAATR